MEQRIGFDMKMKIISVLCVVAFISLFLSSIACAESWVLWKKTEFIAKGKSNISWEIIDAMPDYNQCLEVKKRVWQAIKKQWVETKIKYGAISEIKEVPYELIILKFKDSSDSSIETLYCLPGGLDPRDKK